MSKDIDNLIDKIYKLSEKIEKVKQRASSLKGRKEEIQKRSYKDYGVTTTEELIQIQNKFKKEIKKEEAEIIEMYEELKKDFD